MLYVCYIMNHVAGDNGHVPLTVLTGKTVDMSNLFLFNFWEPVYFATGTSMSYSSNPGLPSKTHEGTGRFVGFSGTVGTDYCFKILTDNTQEIIHCPWVRSRWTEDERNAYLIDGITNHCVPDKGEHM